MRCVEGDLSGKKELHVHLWVKKGQGDGVITDVSIQKAPLNHASSAISKVGATLPEVDYGRSIPPKLLIPGEK